MGGRADLIGRNFGKLTVVCKTTERTKNGDVIWKCDCECGGATKMTTAELRKRSNPSCGCALLKSQQNFAAKQRNDLTDKRFGNLTVTQRVSGYADSYHTTWECRCDCGNTVVVSSAYLLRKTKIGQSCGCLHGYKFSRKKRYELITGISVPSDYYVVFLDGDTSNWNKSNLYHISNAVRQKMAYRDWFSKDAAQTLTAIKICELEAAIKSKENRCKT